MATLQLHYFAAAHHRGSVFVVGGTVGEAMEGPLNPHVYALSLSTMTWRKVPAKGIPPPQLEVLSSAVWRTSICIKAVDSRDLYLFDMATEQWSKRKIPIPKYVCVC